MHPRRRRRQLSVARTARILVRVAKFRVVVRVAPPVICLRCLLLWLRVMMMMVSPCRLQVSKDVLVHNVEMGLWFVLRFFIKKIEVARL